MKILKMNKFLGVLLSLVVFVSSGYVSAAAEYVPEYSYIASYALEEPYKDMEITTTSATYDFRATFGNSVTPQTGNIVYGAVLTGWQSSANNFIPKVTLTLRNGNGVLFDTPGVITLRMLARCYQMSVTALHRDGSQTTLTPDPSTFDDYTVDIKINNFDADIYGIVIVLTASPSNSDGDYLSCSIQYGYKFENGSILSVVSNFFKSFFTNMFSTIGNGLKSFFGTLTGTLSFDSKVSNLESAENSILDSAGGMDSIEFFNDIKSIEGLNAAFSFITPVLVILFENIKFSVILQVTASLFLAVVLMGFVRFWRGSDKKG